MTADDITTSSLLAISGSARLACEQLHDGIIPHGPRHELLLAQLPVHVVIHLLEHPLCQLPRVQQRTTGSQPHLRNRCYNVDGLLIF